MEIWHRRGRTRRPMARENRKLIGGDVSNMFAVLKYDPAR